MAAAELGVIDSQRFSLVLRATRLEAEKSGDELPQDWTLPIDTAEKRMALADESALFEARRTARDAAQSRLAEQRSQIQEEVTGLTGQQQALSTEIALLDSETSEMETLYAKGLVTISRINGLKRARASLAGDLSQVQASLAGAASRLLELSEQEAQTKNATEAEILDDLRDTQSRLADIDQRRLALAARLERRVIRAPLAGTVHDLNLTGPGSVATPGQTLVTIVPSEQQWFIEAQIAPGQIEQVKAGGDCAVRLLTLDPQATRRVPCKVTYVGAAAETDARTGASYFTLRASLQTVQDDGTQMPAFMPGMTAEVFVETGSRSIMSYLLEPLGRQIERSMREP
jgi:membrane fusion protein